MRKLLWLTALLGVFCLVSCATATDGDPSAQAAVTMQTTPVIPAESDPDATIQTDPSADESTTDLTATQQSATTQMPLTTVTTSATTVTTSATTAKLITTDPEEIVDEPAVGTSITVRYVVNNSAGGSLSGVAQQTVRYGETKSTVVKATANLGYRFVGWSDGESSVYRSGDCPTENTVYTAIFEYDALELPIISITTETGGDVTSKTEYINGTIAITNCDTEYILEEMGMEIRGRGNFSWHTPKKSYRVKLSKKQNLLGQGEGAAKSWTLIANHCDQSLIRNYITLNYARRLENIAFMSSAVSVDLYLNGEYRGVYLLCEQNQVHEYRVNIAENPESLLTGYFIEMSNYAAENVFYAGGRAYETKNDLSTSSDLYNRQQAYIADVVQRCWDAVLRGDREEIEKLLDIPSVVDTYIVEELFKNKDDGWDSFYMYYDATVEGEVLHFGPIWDFDLSGGNADDGCESYEGLWAGISGQMQDNGWFYTLMQYNWFRKLVVERWNELKGETDQVPAAILAEARAGFNAYSRNFEKWQIFGQRINLEPPQVRALRSYTEHYEYYAAWMTGRIAWLDGYFNDPTFAFDGTLSLQGDGTKEFPYLVSSAEEFMNLTLCMESGQTFAGMYFRQTADIDMTDVSGYAGVGKGITFAGIYDGAGYTIRAVISGYDGCIFPYVTGTVMNLFTEGSIQNSEHAAGICRSVRVGGVIVNCGSTMTLSGSYAGGIASSNEQGGGTIAGCTFLGSVSGWVSASPINCYNDGRGGSYDGNYYVPGLPHTTAGADASTPKNETELNAELIANALNDRLARTASAAGVSVADLCGWTTQNGSPVLQSK